MTLDDHILSETRQILESISGLAVSSSAVRDYYEHAPMALVRMAGDLRGQDSPQGHSSAWEARLLVSVFIKGANAADSLNTQRNEIKEAISHAVDLMNPSDYTGTRYAATGLYLRYDGASGILDDKSNTGRFIVTLSCLYTRTPIIT